MMSEVIGEKGLTERKIEGVREQAMHALAEVKQRKWPELAFMGLPWQDTREIKAEAGRLSEICDDFLLLGIGGSALGPKCILEALSPLHNLNKKPRVFIYDNVDPSTLEALLNNLDLHRTAVNVISKSGATAETAAGFMIVYDMLKKLLGGKAAGRFTLTTDPEKGDLRRLAREKGIASLPIPPGVGGRYSVLSSVGLLLAELVGIGSDGLLEGARDIHERCMREELWENPALIMACLCFLMDREEGRGMDVLFPYSDRLRAFSEWFCQLWAESLGKLGMGLTPYPSVGTTDQHSQVQLWAEGPHDKVVIFLSVEDYGVDYEIPNVLGEYDGMRYLAGRSLSELIRAEEEATELALAKAGRPNMTIHVPRVDAYHLGQLFYFFEITTAMTGFLYGVNPFNQPSVEEGKLLTFGMMGKPGFEAKKREIEEARGKKNIFRI
jgi:glucose-6-phosphate isomerase